MLGGNISVLAGSHVYATGDDSDVFIQARSELLIAGNAVSGSVKPGKVTSVINAVGSALGDDRSIALSGTMTPGTYNLTISLDNTINLFTYTALSDDAGRHGQLLCRAHQRARQLYGQRFRECHQHQRRRRHLDAVPAG